MDGRADNRAIWRRVLSFLRGARGATSIEYAIFAGLVAAVIIAAVVFLGERTNDNFDCTGQAFDAQAEVC